MAVTINGSVLTQNDPTGVTPSTLTFTSTVLTAGDIVLLIVNQNAPANPPTAGTPTGGTGLSWSTAIDQANTSGHDSRTTAFWTKVPSDQTSTITVSTTAGGGDCGSDGILYRLSGVDQVTPIGQTDGFQGQTDPTGANLQLSGTLAGSMIFMAASDWSAGTAALTISITSTTGGTTDRSNLESGQYRSIAFHADQSGSTNQGTLDYSAATGDWAAVIFEVEAAAVAGGGYVRSAQPGKTWKRRFKHRQWAPQFSAVTADIRSDTAESEFGLSADVTAKKVAVVSAISSLGLTATPVAKKVSKSTGVGTAGLTSTVTAKKISTPTALGAMGLSANAIHVDVRSVTALATLGLTSTSTAKKVGRPTVSAPIGLAGTSTAKKVSRPALSAPVGLAGIVTAKKKAPAAGLGALGLQAMHSGVSPRFVTVIGPLGLTCTLVAKKRATPISVGVLSLSGNALPKKISKSTGAGILALVGISTVRKKQAVTGRATLGLQAEFLRTPPVLFGRSRTGAADGTHSLVGAGVGPGAKPGIGAAANASASTGRAPAGRPGSADGAHGNAGGDT